MVQVGGGYFCRWRTVMEKNSYRRAGMDDVLALIENDLLARLDHPTAHQLEIARDAAQLAFRLRWDATCGEITQDTHTAALMLEVFLRHLKLDKQMTVAAASLRYPVAGRA
jgi:hypothetical protein